MKCPLDQSEMLSAFETRVLGKYDSTYEVCPDCGLVKPTEVTWLEEAYSSAIARSDIGIIQRNRIHLALLESVLFTLAGPSEKILDVGGGYGILCRGLRDQGFDCYTTDSYCENLFARGYEPGNSFKARFLLAFEVYEHIDDALSFSKDLIQKYEASFIIFSTLAYEADSPPKNDWWYYTLETGQHISIYHYNSLKMLASKLGWHYSCLRGLHVLSAKPLKRPVRFLLSPKRRVLARIYALYVKLLRRKRSLLASDYQAIRSEIIKARE